LAPVKIFGDAGHFRLAAGGLLGSDSFAFAGE
jgi:hypothetical protein